MTSEEMILKDLGNHYNDKVKKATSEMIDMCRTVDIEPEAAVAMVLATLLVIVGGLMAETSSMSPEDFGRHCADMIRVMKGKHHDNGISGGSSRHRADGSA